MQLIFLLVENEVLEIISSDALVFETQRNPYSDRQTFVELVLQKAKYFQPINQEVLEKAQQIEASNRIKGIDALHLACAEVIGADFLITCDDKLAKRYNGSLKVKNPTEFTANFFNSLDEEEEDESK